MWNPREWFSSNVEKLDKEQNSGGCPVVEKGGCPVKHDSLEEAARHSQTPHPDQRIPLSTTRAVSSIPRANHVVPQHQPPQEQSKWVYPSEQQFYNAMRKKGWEGIDESSIPLVVRIHNAVNERSWNEVKRWERELHGVTNPRLVRFLGRPKDRSLKALFNTYVLWYNPPFDRHDWYVDRRDGKEPRRYIIDFYNGNDNSTNNNLISTIIQRARGTTTTTREEQEEEDAPPRPPAMYLDVRPAGDNMEAFVDRARMFVRQSFPGIFYALEQKRIAAKPNNSPETPKTTE